MKVRELIEHLQALDPELDVYAAKDAEGNGYNEVYWAPSESYASIEGRHVEVYCDVDIEEMKDNDEDLSGLTKIVVI